MGFDCCSFRKIKYADGVLRNKKGKLVALDELNFNELTENTKLICILKKISLYESSQSFKDEGSCQYLPIYIHDIVRLNELFRKLPKIYSKEELMELYKNNP